MVTATKASGASASGAELEMGAERDRQADAGLDVEDALRLAAAAARPGRGRRRNTRFPRPCGARRRGRRRRRAVRNGRSCRPPARAAAAPRCRRARPRRAVRPRACVSKARMRTSRSRDADLATPRRPRKALRALRRSPAMTARMTNSSMNSPPNRRSTNSAPPARCSRAISSSVPACARRSSCRRCSSFRTRSAPRGSAARWRRRRAPRSAPIDVVASPAIGGIVPGYETARWLGAKAIFVEREDGVFKLRRGFDDRARRARADGRGHHHDGAVVARVPRGARPSIPARSSAPPA